MDVEDYFIIALVFAVVAFLSLLMRDNPFGMWLNTDNFPLFTNGVYMYNNALSLFIFLPTAYFAIAFAVGGVVKTIIRIGKKGKT